jgi:hypothetical protein
MMTAMTDDSNESSSVPPLDVAAPNDAVSPTLSSGHTPTRMSFFDEEYVGGQRVPSPSPPVLVSGDLADTRPTTGTGINSSSVTAQNCLDIQERIHRLLERDYVRDFKAHLIPSLEQAPEFHRRLNELMARQNRVETSLEHLLDDRLADGTPLEPTRDSEPEYQRMSSLVERLNRSMLTIYAEYLGAQAAYILAQPSLRKRPLLANERSNAPAAIHDADDPRQPRYPYA